MTTLRAHSTNPQKGFKAPDSLKMRSNRMGMRFPDVGNELLRVPFRATKSEMQEIYRGHSISHSLITPFLIPCISLTDRKKPSFIAGL